MAAKKKSGVVLLVGTRKGAFFLKSDAARRAWTQEGPHFLGNIVNHVVLDPRDGKTMLLAARTGHLGPTVFRSTDGGKNWQEASRPPAFARAARGNGEGKAVEHVFWLTPGHPAEPGTWYAGSAPHGLFESGDGGVTWDPVQGFNGFVEELAARTEWAIGVTPGGALTHSIIVDPTDADHLYLGLSTGGCFESRDRGGSWTALNLGLEATFLPVKDAEFGHDPHCIALHPLRPKRLYQANHCGIYRLDRPSDTWKRIGKKLPAEIGDIGFPIVLHPRDADTAWVFPMDGTSVWPRTSPGGRPAVYRTSDGGRSWERQARGFPRSQGWLTVLRQAFATDAGSPVGLYLGTTSGEIWASRSEGGSWTSIAAHLPAVLSVEAAGGA